MKPTNRLVLVLALALGVTATGCSAADPSTMGDDDGGGGGGGGGGTGTGSDGQPKPLDATGSYALHSTFDLATNMPGTAGTVVNTIIDATDSSDDPTGWILDHIIAQISNSTVKAGLGTARLFVTGYLNQRVLDLAPDFVTTMVQVGHDFGDLAKHFSLDETLALTRSTTGYTAVLTVTGAHFKLGNQESDYAFASYGVPNVVVGDIAVTMDPTGQLAIAAYKIPLAYGRLLRLGLDGAIIPAIDSSAHNLDELLAHNIDCQGIGTAIYNALADFLPFPVGSASLFAGACTAGITAAASYVYAKIDAIDGSALEFGLSGTARATDKNNDRNIDAIVTGSWSGTLSYAGQPTPLLPATFTGERM